jgi:hypothetical protein
MISSTRKPRLRRWQAAGLLFLGLGLALYVGLMGRWGDQELSSRWVLATLAEFEEAPRLAPDIEGEAIDGRPLRLRDFRGQVVVLSFWGHW